MNEKDVMLELSRWLDENGFEVFWNQKNEYGYNVFKVEGEQKKPDLFIRKKENPFWWQTAIEVKPADDASMRDSQKIIKYAKLFTSGKTRYYTNGVPLSPKYFLSATAFSPEGKLLENEPLAPPPRPGGRREFACNHQFIPIQEYARTYDFVRQMWVTWRDFFDRQPPERIGVLLSDKLDGGIGKPGFFFQECGKKNKWVSKWRVP